MPVPVMVPFVGLVTVRVLVWIVNVAVTVLSAVIVTVQVPAPEQAPDQPVKV